MAVSASLNCSLFMAVNETRAVRYHACLESAFHFDQRIAWRGMFQIGNVFSTSVSMHALV